MDHLVLPLMTCSGSCDRSADCMRLESRTSESVPSSDGQQGCLTCADSRKLSQLAGMLPGLWSSAFLHLCQGPCTTSMQETPSTCCVLCPRPDTWKPQPEKTWTLPSSWEQQTFGKHSAGSWIRNPFLILYDENKSAYRFNLFLVRGLVMKSL